MTTLLTTLNNYDLHMLRIIANRWDVDLETNYTQEAAEQLAEAMLDEERAATEWGRLSDKERGAFLMLLGARDHKMTLAQYGRFQGDIREMGEDRRQRETPHLKPLGMAELLYYRGLIGVMYDQAAASPQKFVYVPHDLAEVLPTHETGYDLSEEPDDFPDDDDDDNEEQVTTTEAGEVELVFRGDTAIVDDVATILAYLQLENAKREANSLNEMDRQAVEEFMLGDTSKARIALIMGLIAGLGLASDDGDGYFKPVPQKARRWLDQPRTQQIHALADTWEASALFNELYYIPSVTLESAAWQNDPTLIRRTVKTFLQQQSETDWVSVDKLVAAIKKDDPDFQRPGGDYDSWYIVDDETGDYLRGFDSWDRVDGKVIEVALGGPMYWLGLADIGRSDLGGMLRLNAYGRAFIEKAKWPQVKDPETLVSVADDGLIQAHRNLSRYDRFQLSRFTEWGFPSGDHYEYFLTVDSLMTANDYGIKAEHIRSFLKRTTDNNIPVSVDEMLEQWEKTGGAAVTLRRADILETDTIDDLEGILNTPELRRFLGARLGDRAVIVRDGQWDQLAAAIRQSGILLEEKK